MRPDFPCLSEVRCSDCTSPCPKISNTQCSPSTYNTAMLHTSVDGLFRLNEMWYNRVGCKKKSGLGDNPKMHLYTLSLRHCEAGFVWETKNWKRNTEKPEFSRKFCRCDQVAVTSSAFVTRLHLQVHRMQVWSTYRQTRHCFNRTFRSWSLPS